MTSSENEDEWNKLVWEFVTYFSRLSFLIAQLVGLFYENGIKPANEVLENEFNALSKANLEMSLKKANYQTLWQTIEINRGNSDIDLAVIIWSHFSHFGKILWCLRKQLDSLDIEPHEYRKIKNTLADLDQIGEFRNDLLHSWLASIEETKGLFLYRSRYSEDWKINKKGISWFLNLEIKKILDTWSDIKSWVHRIIASHKK